MVAVQVVVPAARHGHAVDCQKTFLLSFYDIK